MTLSSAATPIVLHSSHFVVLCLACLSKISFFLEELFVECRVSGLGAMRAFSVAHFAQLSQADVFYYMFKMHFRGDFRNTLRC